MCLPPMALLRELLVGARLQLVTNHNTGYAVFNYILGRTRSWQVGELTEECGAVGQALSPPVAAASMYRATLPLDAKQIASFHENGFVVHPTVSTASEAAR